MPLCPQITITPITVTSTNMTVTSVIAGGDPATTEQLSTVNTNASAAYNAAIAAQSDAATAIANAAAAQASATSAYNTAVAANTAASTAQTTADGKNKVTYSTSTPGSTANAVGDIWYRYGTSGANNGRIIAQYMGAGGTSWTQTTVSGLVVANIDAGSITTGTLSVGLGITGPTYAFSVNAVTGQMTATGVTVTGEITATTGTFTGTVYASAGTFTGTVTATTGSFTGAIYATSGYIGAASTGWNFSSSGYITNNDLTTIFYPTAAANTYVLITDRSISTGGVQSSGNILTTGTAKVTAQGTTSSRCEFNYFNTIVNHSISSGYGVDSDWAPQSDNTYNLGQATSAGYGANRRWQRLYSNNTTISTSDISLKTDVSNSALGLNFINSLRPISYRWKVGKQEVVKDAEGNPIIIGQDPQGKPIYEMTSIPGVRLHYGFIAQEVKQAVDASGVEDFAGWVKDDLNDPNSTESLSYEQFIAPMAKAIQELSARVTTLEGGN
jgi:hypothetical protein